MRPATLVEPRVLPEVSLMRADDRRQRRVQWGTVTLEPLTEPIHGAATSGQLVTLPAGREPALVHRHEGEEWVTAVSGVVEIRVDGRSFVLRDGDSLHFRAHLEHGYVNLTERPAVLIMVVRPRLSL